MKDSGKQPVIALQQLSEVLRY